MSKFSMKDFGADTCGLPTMIRADDGAYRKVRSYSAWCRMFYRCYSDKFHESSPTYLNCSIDNRWKKYSEFKDWFDVNYIPGFDLDKDILVCGNKVYSPEFCRYIPKALNLLLNKHENGSGEFPQGVSFDKRDCMIQSHIRINGKQHRIGYYDSVQEAHIAYKSAKEDYVKKEAKHYFDNGDIKIDIYNSLMSWKLQ